MEGKSQEAAAASAGMSVRTARKWERPIDGYEPSWIHGANRSCIEQGFLPELQEFVDAIREGREPESSIEQSVHMLAIYEALVRSTESGRPEEVEQA